MQWDSEVTPPELLGQFFAAIEEKLTNAREANLRQSRVFFNQLEPRLTVARELDRKLSHHLAHRFNVFRYLRDDERGLSRIIADLLNPNAAHGQGPLFLRILLDRLKVGLNLSDTDLSRAKVFVERSIEKNRLIDIYLEISAGEKRYGFAIENKPYANDQHEQVKDYLSHLAARFGQDPFHLIYLSPTGEPPAEASLPKAEFEQWRGHLLIMPYHDRHTDEEGAASEGKRDEFKDFQAPCSLSQWFADCRAQCEAQRMRWFLVDAESYCRRTFGDTDMASDLETKTVLELLESEPSHLETARVVYESWPKIRGDVFEKFLKHLGAKIRESLLDSSPDIDFDARYEGEGKGAVNGLSIYRTSWPQRQDAVALGRWAVRLYPTGRAWYGVWSPLKPSGASSPDSERLTTLEDKLRDAFPDFRKRDGGWAVWRYVEEDWCNWHKVVSELHRETRDGDGEITRYYVETLVNFAKRAIPIISNVEGSKSSQD